MPKSKSKRSSYTPPKPPKPKPSPRWVPILGISLIGIGVLQVVVAYLVPLPGGNANIVMGFVLMAGGLIALSRWR